MLNIRFFLAKYLPASGTESGGREVSLFLIQFERNETSFFCVLSQAAFKSGDSRILLCS